MSVILRWSPSELRLLLVIVFIGSQEVRRSICTYGLNVLRAERHGWPRLWTVPASVDTRLSCPIRRESEKWVRQPCIYAGVQGQSVAFVLDGGRSVAEVARNIGVHEMTLGKWGCATNAEVALSSG